MSESDVSVCGEMPERRRTVFSVRPDLNWSISIIQDNVQAEELASVIWLEACDVDEFCAHLQNAKARATERK